MMAFSPEAFCFFVFFALLFGILILVIIFESCRAPSIIPPVPVAPTYPAGSSCVCALANVPAQAGNNDDEPFYRITSPPTRRISRRNIVVSPNNTRAARGADTWPDRGLRCGDTAAPSTEEKNERTAKTHGRAPPSKAIEFCSTIGGRADKEKIKRRPLRPPFFTPLILA